MPTLSAGAINSGRTSRKGVTLLELLIVMTLIALVVGVAYPSAAAGVESLRLRSVTDSIASFLNTAVDRATRRQQVVEIWISPKDNAFIARSPDLAFSRRLDIPESFRITSVLPQAQLNPDEPRRFLLYPGGMAPRLGVEISNNAGRKRWVSMDPFTGMPSPLNESPVGSPSAVRELH